MSRRSLPLAAEGAAFRDARNEAKKMKRKREAVEKASASKEATKKARKKLESTLALLKENGWTSKSNAILDLNIEVLTGKSVCMSENLPSQQCLQDCQARM